MTTSGLGVGKLFRNIRITFVRQMGASLVSLLTAVIIARWYGPEGNGTLAVALLMPALLSTLLNAGVPAANVYHLGSAQVSVGQLIAANFRIFFIAASCGVGIGAISLMFYGPLLFPDVDPVVLWVAFILFPISLLNLLLHSIFQGLQLFRPYNIIAVSHPLLFLVLTCLLVIFGYRNVLLLLIGNIISQAVVLVFTIIIIKPLLGPRTDSELTQSIVAKTLHYGWKAHLSNIFAFVNYKADIFLVNFFLGPAIVGVYVIAVALAEKIWMISQAVSTVLLPRLSQLSADEDSRRLLTPLVSRWVMLATVFCAIMLAVFASFIISLIFGENYLGALTPLWILLLGIVFVAPSRVIANDISARGRPELNMFTAIFVVSINIIGNLLLIPEYGLLGAATATSVAYGLDLGLRLFIYWRLTGIRWVDMIFIKTADLSSLMQLVHRR